MTITDLVRAVTDSVGDKATGDKTINFVDSDNPKRLLEKALNLNSKTILTLFLITASEYDGQPTPKKTVIKDFTNRFFTRLIHQFEKRGKGSVS